MLALTLSAMLAGASTTAAAPAAEPANAKSERKICKSRPKLGSRVVAVKTCKTAEEWNIYNKDLEQSRRDINDRGARGNHAYGDGS